ncbi:Hypothetical predicted protein [Xyrichtys novacula]|uniref:Uncharacterized protein n=1 Tax=Xyrichtys novacula TaxID=13765 RepID=A0AAV1FLD6_XYRNO|nr:Hypothetical predicted protein [Xyrichtys novacula]
MKRTARGRRRRGRGFVCEWTERSKKKRSSPRASCLCGYISPESVRPLRDYILICVCVCVCDLCVCFYTACVLFSFLFVCLFVCFLFTVPSARLAILRGTVTSSLSRRVCSSLPPSQLRFTLNSSVW